MNMYLKEATEKLDRERSEAKASGKERAIISEVCDALKLFCEQDGEFAQAVVQTDGTLSDCCKHILKDVGSSISDLQATFLQIEQMIIRKEASGDAGNWRTAIKAVVENMLVRCDA